MAPAFEQFYFETISLLPSLPMHQEPSHPLKPGMLRSRKYYWPLCLVVETDHKPLETIFQKPFHQSPLRLQKKFMKLMGYDLDVKYKKDKELFIADTLSRAYLPEAGNELDDLEIAAVLPMSEEKLSSYNWKQQMMQFFIT